VKKRMGKCAVKKAKRLGGRVIFCLVLAAAVSLGSAGSASAAYNQEIDPGNSLNGVSCVPGTTTCIAANSLGDALYATDVSVASPATWNPWNGPSSQGPGRAVECPASTLCLLAAGEGIAARVDYATSIGGPFSTAFLPANDVGDISCPSASFCVSAQEGNGFIRYSTAPASISWTAVIAGTDALKGVQCLSASFCAVVNDSGDLYVATTEQGVKETAGWTSTDVDGATALRGIACSSTTSCIAVDGSNEVLALTIAPDGKATVARQVVGGANALSAVTCMGSTCAAGDAAGSLFSSTNGGGDWTMRYGGADAFTSVSCASASLCAGVTTSGNITTFDPSAVVAPLTVLTDALPTGVAGAPYAAQVEAAGGTPPNRWSATGLPPGLAIDQASGLITGTPRTAICVRSPCPQPPATYTATVTVTDSDGIPASRQLTISILGDRIEIDPAPAPAPAVTNLKASHRVWRTGTGPARISKVDRGARKRPPIGTTFSFELNVTADVTFSFTRHVAGRKAGAGSLAFAGHPGKNNVAFRGRISRKNKLKPGRYTLTVTAASPDGQRSAPASLNFKVVG
jgi:putative Ig domain-containing protein